MKAIFRKDEGITTNEEFPPEYPKWGLAKHGLNIADNSILEPVDIERDLEDEKQQYCDMVENSEFRHGEERGRESNE